MRKDNTTGITGVAKAKKGFMAYVTFRQNKFPLGNYKTIEEAAAARKEAERLLYEPFLAENAGWEDRIKEVISSALKEAERNR